MFFLSALPSLGLLTSFVSAQYYNVTNGTSASNASTYTNPILDEVGADPWVIRHGDYYYMTYTTNSNITILR
ncbi:hypothetical protein KCU96_g9629, partial [Aureobasidium melanogenum]